MAALDRHATSTTDTVVDLSGVWKVYRQRVRSARVSDLWRNLLRPEIRVVEALRGVDLTVRRGVTIIGTIKNTRGIPVAGATINFSDDRGVAEATDTDAAGRYGAVVLPGRFGVDVTPPFVGNLLGKTTSIDVRASMQLDITLEDVAP